MTKVYLDMDGVLADFFGRWEEIIGCSYKEINSAEQFSIAADKFIKGTDFFYTLKPFDHAKSLTSMIKEIFSSKPNILSAPIAGDVEHTVKMKTKWLNENIGEDQIGEKIFTHDKHIYANGNILIDDYLPNLVKWAKNGGIGIKYKANSNKYEFSDLFKAINNAKTISDLGMKGQIIFLR